MRLLWLDYLAALRERKTWLAALLMAYAVIAMPLILVRPPAHVREAITAWFGSADPFTMFLYVWIDLTLNKAIAFLPAVLASGIVLRERDTLVLEVIAAKPISMPRFFVLRTISACAVMVSLYVAAHAAGVFWFAAHVPRFRAGTFFAAIALHLFAAIFGVALTATMAVWIGRRAAAALLSIVVLSTLSGLALMGFYQPAWRNVALLNPYALGASALGHVDSLGPGVLVPPMLVLAALSVVTVAAGIPAVRRIEI